MVACYDLSNVCLVDSFSFVDESERQMRQAMKDCISKCDSMACTLIVTALVD